MVFAQGHRRLDFLIPSSLENPDAFAQTQDMDFAAILTIAASNVAFALCCLFLYEMFRSRGNYFMPKLYWRPELVPRPLPTGRFLNWVRPLVEMDEETVLRCAGVDAVIYLRAMKLGITIFSLFVAVGFGLLLPVNLSCSKWEDGDESSKYYDLNLFMQCTLSNVPAKDRRLWAHSAASYLLTFITMHLLAKENRAYAKMRHRFLSSKTVNLRTILVERIPRDLRSNSRLKAYFNAMYPGKVYDVHLSQDLSPLEKLLQKRNHILCQLERCIMKKHLTGLEPQHSPHPFCCFGGLIDSIPYYSNLLQHLNAAVSKGQVHRISTMAARDHENETATARQYVEQFFQRTQKWAMERRSEPSDLHYQNQSYRHDGHVHAFLGEDYPLEAADLAGLEEADLAHLLTDHLPPTKEGLGRFKDVTFKPPSHEHGYAMIGTHGVHGTNGTDHRNRPYQQLIPSRTPVHRVESDLGQESSFFGVAKSDYSKSGVEETSPLNFGSNHGVTIAELDYMDEDDDDLDSDEEADMMNVERTEWNRNICSRILLVFQYATSTTSCLRDLRRVLCQDETGRRKQRDDYRDTPRAPIAPVQPFQVPPQANGTMGGASMSQGGAEGSGKAAAEEDAIPETMGLLSPEAMENGNGSAVSGENGEGGGEAGGALPAALSEEGRMMSKAFVTFRTLSAATIAQQVLHYAKPGGMTVTAGPEPRDIFWQNLYMARQEGLYRRLIVNFVIGLGLITYVIPVTLINFVASSTALKEYVPFVDKLCTWSPLFDTMVEMVQPMCLMGLMALLPPIILGMSYWEGTIAMSWAQHRQTSRYFAFLVVNVFLVSTVAGSVLKALGRVADEPELTFKMLADSLPKVSGFFCCYLLMKGVSGMSMELARIVPVMQHVLKRMIYPSLTPRDRKAEVFGTRDFDNPGWFPYGKYCAQDLLIVVVTMTYACIAPLILIPALIFFSMAFLVYKHQMLYVYIPAFESGGMFWPKIYRRWIFALFIAQATMTGIFILKFAYPQVYAELALMVLTYIYKMKMRSTYTWDSVAAHLPLELATSLDASLDKEDDELLHQGINEYIQPALRAKAVEAPDSVGETGQDIKIKILSKRPLSGLSVTCGPRFVWR